MKKLLLGLLATAACLHTAQAQISVGAGGSGILTFDAAPAATEWATATVAGNGGTITDVAGLDAAVGGLTAGGITTVLPTSGTEPPSTSAAGFRYNTSNDNIQSRVTTVAATILKAVLQNDTGSDQTTITVSYTLGSGQLITEQIPGIRAYYSVSGNAGTWVNIPELSVDTPGTLTAVLNVGNWVSGSQMFLLWADDNADPGTDGHYTIDNFQVTPGGTVTETVAITTPADGATFPQGAPITINAFASMAGPIQSVSFFRNGVLIGTDTAAPYSIVYSNAPLGASQLTASATDNTHTINSAIVNITVNPNNAPVLTITAPANGTNVLVGTLVNVSATATDSDGSITDVDFYLDGVLQATDTTSTYTYEYGNSLVGTHTITAVATDNSGVSFTNTISVIVTNPAATVLLPNGSSWKYLDDGTDPGATWNMPFFDDSGWSNGVGELGFGDTDVRRPEATVIRRLIGTPPTAITNTTFYFRRVVNIPTPTSYDTIVLRIQQDDGAIVYLNGNEIYRATNMVGVSGHGAYATSTQPDDGAAYYTTNLPSSLFVPGDNLIAVEVHQNNLTSSDISFDLMLWGIAPEGPELQITQHSPTQVKVSWPVAAGGASQLYYKNDLSDANWTLETTPAVVNGSNYEVIVTTTTRRFWTLRQ